MGLIYKYIYQSVSKDITKGNTTGWLKNLLMRKTLNANLTGTMLISGALVNNIFLQLIFM